MRVISSVVLEAVADLFLKKLSEDDEEKDEEDWKKVFKRSLIQWENDGKTNDDDKV